MAFPTTGLLDDFNRADADPLNGNWNPNCHLDGGDTNAKITSNAAGFSICSTAWLTATGADCECYFNVPTIISGGRVRASARLSTQTSTPTGYSADWTPDVPQFDLIRWDGGAGGVIIASSGVFAMAANDSLGIACVGSSIQAWQKASGTWVKRIDFTDATYALGGFIGFALYNSPFSVDNFSGGTVVTGGPGDDPPIGVLGRGAGW